MGVKIDSFPGNDPGEATSVQSTMRPDLGTFPASCKKLPKGNRFTGNRFTCRNKKLL